MFKEFFFPSALVVILFGDTNPFRHFCRWPYKENLCEVIRILTSSSDGDVVLSFFYLSSGGHFFSGAEPVGRVW